MTDSHEALVESTRSALLARGHTEANISTLHVPGRIEVFGKHTDYCGGRSLLIAIEQGLCFSVAARADKRIHIRSIEHDVQCDFELDTEITPTLGHWSNYPMTVARRVARNFPTARIGCDIAIASNLPPAAGMSSSSAMIIGTFLALDRINRLCETSEYRASIMSREDLSAYLGSIENGSSHRSLIGDRGVGTSGGSQDHTAILCCRANVLSQYAFCPVRAEREIEVPADLRFVIGVSGIIAQKTGSALHRYNAVADAARAIVTRFNEDAGKGFACLADIVHSAPDAIENVRSLVGNSPDLLARFEQFVEESDTLIPAAADAFATRSWTDFGRLADRSQELAERCLRNQIPQTIRLQRTARDLGAIASSAFGAGFGGSVWALVEMSNVDSFLHRWSKCEGTFHPTRASDGARWLS